jgi:hypothetical protein
MSERYLDLDRRFYEACVETGAEDEAVRSYLFGVKTPGMDITWSELLEHELVVILGEAGSGKTTELRLQADRLRGESEKVFLLQLDRLVSTPFIEVLAEQGRCDFRDWQRTQVLAYFLFDSVDESKIRRTSDFFTALDRISEVLDKSTLSRARIVLTSRISEWRPTTDTEEVRKRLGIDCPSSKSGQKHDQNGQRGPFVVCLAPLDRPRVRRFAEFLQIEEPDRCIFRS